MIHTLTMYLYVSTHTIIIHLLVAVVWVQEQGLVLHQHSPADMVYQSVHSSPNSSRNLYQLISTHQYCGLFPINKIHIYTITYSKYYQHTRFFIHLLAWPWGSINSGHRRENWTITPFSTDKVSRGRPQICQDLIFTGLDRVNTRLTPSV